MIVVVESVVRLNLSLLIMLALVLVIPTTTTLPVYASHDDQDANPETSDSGDSEDSGTSDDGSGGDSEDNNVATQDNIGTSGGSGGDSEDDDDSSNNIPQIQGSDNIPLFFGEQGGDGNQPKFGTDECKKRGLIVASGVTFDRAQFIECSDLDLIILELSRWIHNRMSGSWWYSRLVHKTVFNCYCSTTN